MSEPQLLQLIFDDEAVNPNAIYKAGEAVRFKVGISSQQPLDCEYVTARIQGKSFVYWSKGRSKYSSTETMVDLEMPIFTPPAGNYGLHPPGDYFYPCCFHLPNNIAASFSLDFSLGHLFYVSYTFTVRMQRARHSNVEIKTDLIVVRDLDLNLVIPSLTGPYESEGPERTRVSCHALLNRGLGRAEIRIRLNKRGFAIGEQIQVTGELRNVGIVDFNLVTMEIVQLCVFLARGHSQRRWRSVSIVRLPPLAAGRSMQLGHLLPVFAANCSYLQGCTNINVNYFFRIRAAGTLTIVKKDLCELIIGSVPIGQQEPVDINTWIPLADELRNK